MRPRPRPSMIRTGFHGVSKRDELVGGGLPINPHRFSPRCETRSAVGGTPEERRRSAPSKPFPVRGVLGGRETQSGAKQIIVNRSGAFPLLQRDAAEFWRIPLRGS